MKKKRKMQLFFWLILARLSMCCMSQENGQDPSSSLEPLTEDYSISFADIYDIIPNKSMALKYKKKHDRQIEENQKKTKMLDESFRIGNIMGFICSCALIREMNNEHYKIAQQFDQAFSCAETWNNYFKESKNPVCVNLRGNEKENIPALLRSEDLYFCGAALCRSFSVCSKHIQCNPNTVQVLNKLRNNDSSTITQMLRKEKPGNLINKGEMELVNTFLIAADQTPFPMSIFKKGSYEYAIPNIRSPTDPLTCPAYFRHPGSCNN